MLELATLGLLLREPLHGYRLKQQLELFMGSCISVNYGAIYPLLKRLEERDLISTIQAEEGNSNCGKKIYTITDKGRDRWRQKMLEHPQESWVNARSRFLIKYCFFERLQAAERIKLLENRLMTCRLRLDNCPMAEMSGDRYQESVLQYGKEVLEGEIAWIAAQLEREQTKLAASLTAVSN